MLPLAYDAYAAYAIAQAFATVRHVCAGQDFDDTEILLALIFAVVAPFVTLYWLWMGFYAAARWLLAVGRR